MDEDHLSIDTDDLESSPFGDAAFDRLEAKRQLKSEFPELYGRMLMANKRIAVAGAGAFGVGLIIVLGLCVAIHMAWFSSLFGMPIERFQSWWVYLLIVVSGFIVSGYYTTLSEKLAWRGCREFVHGERRKQHLSVPGLVTRADGIEEVAQMLEHLKSEPTSALD